ncbi:MAG: thioredoxin family protein [Acetobacteraceae bacterium]|nr:thioredoxin family protein [Acetobacteraceae bacterium]
MGAKSFLICAVLVLLMASRAWALESAPVRSERAEATLVTDTDAITSRQQFWLGRRLRLAPGWHTYSDPAGDAGIPPTLRLSLPTGFTAGKINWPPSQTFKEGPLTSYGYTGEVVFPVTVTPGGQLAETTIVSADAEWLVCEKICIPEEGSFRLKLRTGTPAPSAQAVLFGPSPRPGSPGHDVRSTAHPDPVPVTRMLGFAFLGGLILNLMPCVFPVLAMKAVSIASGTARGEVRAHAISYTAGVLVTFAALGAVLAGLRATGAAAGWGFQFQSPIFVAAMCWLLFGVGLNLSGVFQVGGGFTGAGQRLAGRGGHIGSFFTGLLAVLVATPCTAPFMGAAVAGALAAPSLVMVLVFLAMGVGLAAPYLVLAAVPALARLAPRPGRWMEVFKQALAFPMYAASAWLLWVISQEAGPPGVLATAAGFVLLGFAAWVAGVAETAAARGKRLARSAALAATLCALAVLGGMGTVASSPTFVQAESGAEPFSTKRLAALRAEGRPVFVNMTAAWCVTCLLNERIAIATSPVQRAFEQYGVAYLKGDWTNQDPEITRFLREHNRDGVPLYLYYPPGGRAAEVLPQILTESMLLNRITPERG